MFSELPKIYCGVEKRLSRQPHELKIAGSSPAPRNHARPTNRAETVNRIGNGNHVFGSMTFAGFGVKLDAPQQRRVGGMADALNRSVCSVSSAG